MRKIGPETRAQCRAIDWIHVKITGERGREYRWRACECHISGIHMPARCPNGNPTIHDDTKPAGNGISHTSEAGIWKWIVQSASSRIHRSVAWLLIGLQTSKAYELLIRKMSLRACFCHRRLCSCLQDITLAKLPIDMFEAFLFDGAYGRGTRG